MVRAWILGGKEELGRDGERLETFGLNHLEPRRSDDGFFELLVEADHIQRRSLTSALTVAKSERLHLVELVQVPPISEWAVLTVSLDEDVNLVPDSFVGEGRTEFDQDILLDDLGGVLHVVLLKNVRG